jgi:glucokinase
MRKRIMANFAIGIDLGGTTIKGVIMDREGNLRHLTRIPTEAEKGGGRVLENVIALIEAIIKKEGSSKEILGVGIGTPGFVDGDGTMLGGAENLPGWKGTQIYGPIEKKLGIRATASNDVTVAALAESAFGAGKGIANMAMLALGTGVGGGIVVNHHVYKGTHGMAAELGHLPVESDGLPCSCGQKGCIESYASGTGIVKNAQIMCASSTDYHRTPFVDFVNKHPDQVTAKIVYDYVGQGDYVAVAVNEFVGNKLARAVGMILNALAPDRMILGGGVMKNNTWLLETVRKHVSKYCWGPICDRCEIVPASCGENAGVLGAAALAFDEFGA